MSEEIQTPRPHVVVVGQMGVGKTTLGKLLAQQLDVKYIDSDEDVIALFGSTGGVVAEEFGIEALHDVESIVLLGALARPEPSVITAAASVADDPLVHVVLARRAQVVWVTADIDEILRRQAEGGHRRSMDRNELLALEERRLGLFESMADVKVVADRAPEELCDFVASALKERSTTQGEDPHA